MKTSTRNIAFLLVAALTLVACRITDRSDRQIDVDMLNNPSSEFSVDPDEMPVIAFEAPVHQFGTLSQGDVLEHTFHFENTGKSPLVLSFVEASCGCTVMKDWPKEPIAPGDAGAINVAFDTKGKSGVQNVSIRVVTNTTPATSVLALEGEVVIPNS